MSRVAATLAAIAILISGFIAWTDAASSTPSVSNLYVSGDLSLSGTVAVRTGASGTGTQLTAMNAPTLVEVAPGDSITFVNESSPSATMYIKVEPSNGVTTIAGGSSAAVTFPAGTTNFLVQAMTGCCGVQTIGGQNYPIGMPLVSGTVTDNYDGTATVTYASGGGSPNVYICPLSVSVSSCNSSATSSYKLFGIRLPSSPATITAGMLGTALPPSGPPVALPVGTYTLYLRDSDMAVAYATNVAIGFTPTPSPSPSPASSKPGAPGKPSAVAGGGSATVTVVAPTSGGTPTSYTVTSSPDSKTCTVTVPATSCEVTGLTNGKAYTFTSTATNAVGTSDASVASDAVTPNLKPNTPTSPPVYAKAKNIAQPGTSVLMEGPVVTPSGETATPRVRFAGCVQGLLPRGEVEPTGKLGTYTVKKSGKVIAHVLSAQPMKISLTLRAPATTEYKAYRSVKTWTLQQSKC